MKLKLSILVLMTLPGVLPVYAQSDAEVQSRDALELKAGSVVNGHAISFSVAAKLYTSPHFAWTPEITLLGGPIVALTMRYDIPLNDNICFTPHLGAGFLPVPIAFSAIGTAGFDMSYAVHSSVRLFLDARIYGFGNDMVSGYGSGIYEVKDLQSKSPIVISVGMSF